MKFRQKLRQFMMGRYGVDELSKFLFWIYLIIFGISLFIPNIIFDVLMIALIIEIYYRFFSKNIYMRSIENTKFLNWKKKIKMYFVRKKKRRKQKGEWVYKTCHHCHKMLKLPIPSKRGIKYVKCPKCHKRNRFLILQKQKIEIIKKESA